MISKTMELNQQNTCNNTILKYDKLSLTTVANNLIKFPCFVSENYWQNMNKFNPKIIIKLAQTNKINLLLIGCKDKISLAQQILIKKTINCEFSNISSAIYNFNLLLSDKRLVGLVIY